MPFEFPSVLPSASEQIYNETIRDLLLPEGRGKPLDLREDTGRGMVIAGLSTHTPKSADEVPSARSR